MRKGYIGLACLATCAVAAGSFFLLKTLQKPAEPTAVTVPKQQTQSVQKPVQLTLPGAKPITPLKQDYEASDSLWLVVSKDYPLPDSAYAPKTLQKATVPLNTAKSDEEMSLRTDVLGPTKQLFDAAKTAGHDIMLASGYRSFTLQNSYYTNYVKTSGEAAANQFSAKPGQSEHQTGLAFDVALANRSCYLETCFADTPAGIWLAEHAHEYGFTLRYPRDKTVVTKYQFEPWHFRYVGRELAIALKESKLTLDEARQYLLKVRDELKKRGELSTRSP